MGEATILGDHGIGVSSSPAEAVGAAPALLPLLNERGLPSERPGDWVYKDEINSHHCATGRRIVSGRDESGEELLGDPDRWEIRISGGFSRVSRRRQDTGYRNLEIGVASDGVTKEVAGRVHAYALGQASKLGSSTGDRVQVAEKVQRYIDARQWEKRGEAAQ